MCVFVGVKGSVCLCLSVCLGTRESVYFGVCEYIDMCLCTYFVRIHGLVSAGE